MREIKFRAWHEPSKKFITSFRLSSNGKEVVEIAWPLPHHYEGECVADFDREKFTLEQFTGLKDKNGKEIYEGDIVEFPSSENVFIEIHYGNNNLGEPPETMRSKIEWVGGGFTFDWECGYEGAEVSWDELKVIGNIHENPELLKD